MSDVQRPGGVRGDELDLHRLAVPDVRAAIVRPLDLDFIEDTIESVSLCNIFYKKIYKSWPSNLDFFKDIVKVIYASDDYLGYIMRRFFLGFGNYQCNSGSKVTVFRIFGRVYIKLISCSIKQTEFASING